MNFKNFFILSVSTFFLEGNSSLCAPNTAFGAIINATQSGAVRLLGEQSDVTSPLYLATVGVVGSFALVIWLFRRYDIPVEQERLQRLARLAEEARLQGEEMATQAALDAGVALAEIAAIREVAESSIPPLV